MTIPKPSKWLLIACAACGVLAIIAIIAYRLSGNRGAAAAAVSLVEASQQPVIQKLQEQLDSLTEQDRVNMQAVAKTKAEIAARKAKMRSGLSSAGISAAEMARRLSDHEL